MNTLTLPAPSVKSAPRPAALDWASTPEVDGYCWVPIEDGPTEADREWAASQHDDSEGLTDAELAEALDGPEPDWDALAEESAALDRVCAGGLL